MALLRSLWKSKLNLKALITKSYFRAEKSLVSPTHPVPLRGASENITWQVNGCSAPPHHPHPLSGDCENFQGKEEVPPATCFLFDLSVLLAPSHPYHQDQHVGLRDGGWPLHELLTQGFKEVKSNSYTRSFQELWSSPASPHPHLQTESLAF